MRAYILASLAAVVATPALAQEETTLLPPIIIDGSAPKGAAPGKDVSLDRCIDVQIGGSSAFDCVNQQFRDTVKKVVPLPNIAPIDARSAGIHVGNINIPALKQQYGRNFGVSVMPYRPPLATYTSPLKR